MPITGDPSDADLKAAFAGEVGGIACVIKTVSGSQVSFRKATASDSPEDIYGWTGWDFRVPVPADEAFTRGSQVPDLYPIGLCPGVDILPNATYYVYDQLRGWPVFYSHSAGKMSFTEGADGVICGIIDEIHRRFPTLGSDDTATSYDATISRGTLQGTQTVNLDDQVDPGASGRTSTSGDKRVVLFNDRPGGQKDATLTINGGGSTLKTLSPGTAAMFEVTSADQDPDDSSIWSLEWREVKDEPYFYAQVELHPDYMRAQALKSFGSMMAIRGKHVASTTGAKQAWTIETDAPTGTTSGASGHLTVGGFSDGEVFRIAAAESDTPNLFDAKLVPYDGSEVGTTYTLLGGNVNVNVSSKGIWVTHVASGAANYTVTTEVWTLNA